MTEIIPAILTHDFELFTQQVRAAEKFAPLLHIDLTDGRFVGSRTIRPADIARVQPTIPFELHCMVDNPESQILDYLALGPKRIIVHQHATDDAAGVLRAIRDRGVEAALAVSPQTLSVDITNLLALLDQVTFLAVDPGAQGNPLIPGVLHKAKTFCQEHHAILVEIDGGIKLANLHQVLVCRVARLVVGSGIWQEKDPAHAYEQFVQAASFLSKP